jgi:hypothetical protein
MTFSANGTQTTGVTRGTQIGIGVSGTFGSGTVSVKYYANGGWVTFSGGDTGDFTAADEREFLNVGETDELQIVLGGATAPSLVVTTTPSRF